MARDDKRHCDEIRRQLIELDELRTAVRSAQESARVHEANHKHAQKECANTRDLLEKEKRVNCKYVQEIEVLKTRNQEVTVLNERQNKYCEDMRIRYEERKKELEEFKVANKDLIMQLQQTTREMNDLKDKVLQSESRVRSLVDEIRALEEKNRTLQSKCDMFKYTSEQFEKQKKVKINNNKNLFFLKTII